MIDLYKFALPWTAGAVSYALIHAMLPLPGCAADLAPPHARIVPLPVLPAGPHSAVPVRPLMQTGRFPSPAPERCLETGVEPISGQTLQADTSCPTGMRWKYQK